MTFKNERKAINKSVFQFVLLVYKEQIITCKQLAMVYVLHKQTMPISYINPHLIPKSVTINFVKLICTKNFQFTERFRVLDEILFLDNVFGRNNIHCAVGRDPKHK